MREGRGIRWMSWEKESTPKQLGGYGFKRFNEVNLAFIGRIAWRLVTKPTCLAARIMKAKYYPNSDFLHAKLGYNLSYMWRGILETQDLI